MVILFDLTPITSMVVGMKQSIALQYNTIKTMCKRACLRIGECVAGFAVPAVQFKWLIDFFCVGDSWLF